MLQCCSLILVWRHVRCEALYLHFFSLARQKFSHSLVEIGDNIIRYVFQPTLLQLPMFY